MSKEATSLDMGVWICIFIWFFILHGCFDKDSRKIEELKERVVTLEAKSKSTLESRINTLENKMLKEEEKKEND